MLTVGAGDASRFYVEDTVKDAFVHNALNDFHGFLGCALTGKTIGSKSVAV